MDYSETKTFNKNKRERILSLKKVAITQEKQLLQEVKVTKGLQRFLSRQLVLTFSSCDASFLSSNIFFSFLEKVIKCPRKSIKNIIRKYIRNIENTKMKWSILQSTKFFFVHSPSHFSKRVKVVSSIQLSSKCKILQRKSVSKNVTCNTLVKSQMWLLKNVLKGNPVYFCLFYGEKPFYSDVIHTNEHKKI